MTNPAPRPALRKAEDSTVHPAAPVRPARTRSSAKAIPTQAAADEVTSTRARSSATAAPAPSGSAATAPDPSSAAKPRRKTGKARAFSGATSDHLRPEAVVAAAEASARTAKKKKDKERERAYTDVDLMRGKTVELDVQVPKRLRKAARDEAKRRGLDLDAVTTELLHRWLTGR